MVRTVAELPTRPGVRGKHDHEPAPQPGLPVIFCARPRVLAAKDSAAPETPPATTRRASMDYGPFLTYSLTDLITPKALPTSKPNAKPPAPREDVIALKGINIKLPGSTQATVCFDTDTLRFAAGWTGGFLDLSKTNMTTPKGDYAARIQGTRAFATPAGPGWAKGDDFTDPRQGGFGNLPKDWAHYKGLYTNGDNVILSYTVGGADVLELPEAVKAGDATAFTRTIRVGPSSVSNTVLICEVAGATGGVATSANLPATTSSGPAKDHVAVLEKNGAATAVGVIDAPADATLEVTKAGQVQLKLPALKAVATFKVVLWSGDKSKASGFPASLAAANQIKDLSALCQGGPAHWKSPVQTAGQLGNSDAAYAVDTITSPEPNPWNAWMRFSGHDFFSDGRAAVCTWNGDVWIVSGIDDKLDHVSWKRFAAGLYEPLGLKIVKDEVYVLGRDQITRLHDLNNDGEADFYENFNNDRNVDPSYHAFCYDLQTDHAGNFYYVAGGNKIKPGIPGHSALFKLPPDGSKLEVIATGLRAPTARASARTMKFPAPTTRASGCPPAGSTSSSAAVFTASPAIREKSQSPATPPILPQPILKSRSSGSR